MAAPLDTASLVIAGLLGMFVGGNNLSACSGTIIGSGMVRRRTGILLAVAGYITGLVIEGPKLFRVTEVFLPANTSTGAFSILLASALGVLMIVVDDRMSPRNLWFKLTLLKAGLLPLAFLSAYVLGVNTLGLIAGVPYHQSFDATIAVGLGAILGAFLLVRGALRRLTEGIFSLSYPNAFFAQLFGSVTVELANQLAVPLSITETVTSGIIGSGLARRMRVLNVRNIFLIISSWIISPIAGFLLAYVITKLL